jgi:AcrR family transcriptional regulator
MPRDATETKARLLREAERLFATRGVYQVTVREIVDAAGQRNVSALTYHFGSRERLLDEILIRHGDPTDLERGELLEVVGHGADTRDLVATLVVPYAAHLTTPEGRDYLRIVSQLAPLFSAWREANPGTGPYLREILGILEKRPKHVPAAVRRERVVEMIMLMTVAMAERARAVESGEVVALDEPTFAANLNDVLVGVLEAPRRGRLPNRFETTRRVSAST